MLPGFYELLGVPRSASTDDIRAAYQRQLASLVRRLRAATRQSADTTVLETQERGLKEAFDVLIEPGRRRRYDAYRRASEEGLPTDAESLWESARGSMVDPAAAAALETLRALTDLPVGEPVGPVPSEPPPPPPVVERTRPSSESVERARISDPPPEAAPAPRLRVAPPPEPPGPVVATAMPPVMELRNPSDEVLFADEDAWDLFPDEDEDELSEPGRSALLTHGGSRRAEPKAAAVAAAVAAAPPPKPKDPIAALVDRYGYDGRFLRGVRELRGTSMEEVSKSTRISLRYLEALEENGYDRLPAGTFVRGYVRTLARILNVNENAVADGYMALFNHHRG